MQMTKKPDMKSNEKNKAQSAKRTGSMSKNTELFLLTLPVIIYVIIFRYLPMVGVILAFKDYHNNLGIWGSPWIGFKNFEFFFKSEAAMRVTLNTLGYNASFIVLGCIINMTVALMLNEVKNKYAIKFYQTTMFIPHFLSWVVVSFIAYAFLSPAYGILNQIMGAFGQQTQNWFMLPQKWPPIMISAGLWKSMGMGVLLNYAVLIGIDKSYYEAAAIDGASKFQMIRKISIPFMIPITVIQMILAIGRIFNSDFGLFYQLPQASTVLYKTTEVIDTYTFRALMDSNDIGVGAAVGFYQALVGLVLVVLTNYIVKKIQPDNSLF